MNSDIELMSRRDWFRLRSPDPARAENPVSRQSPETLHGDHQPVAEPVNHAKIDLSTLPPLCESLIDRSQVEQLRGDLAEFASEVTLIMRTKGVSPSNVAAAKQRQDLRLAFQTLLQGGVNRLQIRYRWNEYHWIDTLERKEHQFRLVRIRHSDLSQRSR